MKQEGGKKGDAKTRAVALLVGLCVAQAAAIAFLFGRTGEATGELDLQQVLADPAIKQQIVAEFVDRGQGLWDTHNDGVVGRRLQPWLDGKKGFGSTIDSNRFGLRERDFEVPKPDGLVRVVLLGDSLIFGEGVDAEDRVGVLLEQELQERSGLDKPYVEVLHFGIGSWDVVGASTFLRRQLSLVRPDLVVQLATSNDLDDSDGVRGFGAKAAFSPRRRLLADSRVLGHFPGFSLGVGTSNLLLLGLDWESRSRYRNQRAALLQLKAAVEAAGGRHLLWLHWGSLNPTVRRHLTQGLEEEEQLYNSVEFQQDQSYWVDAGDPHWNPEGMEVMAKLLYGAIQTRGLLPRLELEPWPEAEEVLREIHGAAWAAGSEPQDVESWLRAYPVGSVFQMARLEECTAHVNGGLDAEGRVSPYASLMMRRPERSGGSSGGELIVEGSGLGRSELDGLGVRVFVDEVPLGVLSVPVEGAFRESWTLPQEVAARPFVSVRFLCDDFVYVGEQLQHCVAFRLERVALR